MAEELTRFEVIGGIETLKYKGLSGSAGNPAGFVAEGASMVSLRVGVRDHKHDPPVQTVPGQVATPGALGYTGHTSGPGQDAVVATADIGHSAVRLASCSTVSAM